MIGHNQLKDLEERARHGLRIVLDGEDAVMDGWIIYGKALNEGRECFPKGDNKKFSDWITNAKLAFEVNPHDRSAAMWAAGFEGFDEYRKQYPNVRTVRGFHAKWQLEQKEAEEAAAREAALLEADIPAIKPILSVEQKESIEKVRELCGEDFEIMAAAQELVDSYVPEPKKEYNLSKEEQVKHLAFLGQYLTSAATMSKTVLAYSNPDEIAESAFLKTTQFEWAESVHDQFLDQLTTFLIEQAPAIGASLIKLRNEQEAPKLKVVK